MIKKLQIADYLSGSEAFHFARSTLVPGTRPVLHCHDFVEMFWVESGRVSHEAGLVHPDQKIAGTDVEPLADGAISFIRPEHAHKLRAKSGTARIANLAFRLETITYLFQRYGADLPSRAYWAEDCPPWTTRLSAGQARTLKIWAHRLDSAGRGQVALDAFLLSVLGIVLQDDPLPEGADSGPPWLIEACRALNQISVLRRGVPAFVEVAGRDASHVARVTKQHCGDSPSTLVAQARMREAAKLLTNSDEPIAAIALEVGLENLSHFYAQFKQHHRLTPRQYRLRHRRDIVGLV